jgi:hypothetical protein
MYLLSYLYEYLRGLLCHTVIKLIWGGSNFRCYSLQEKIVVETTINQKRKRRKKHHLPKPEEHGGIP